MKRLLRIVACAAVALAALLAAPALRHESDRELHEALGMGWLFTPTPDARYGPDGRRDEPDILEDPGEMVKRPENQARLWKARAMEYSSYACWGVVALAAVYAVWPARRKGGKS